MLTEQLHILTIGSSYINLYMGLNVIELYAKTYEKNEGMKKTDVTVLYQSTSWF